MAAITMSDEQHPNEHQHPPHPIHPAAPKRRRWTLRRVSLLLLVVTLLVVGVGLYLLRSEPAHWKKRQDFLRSTSSVEQEAIAESAQHKIMELANLGLEQLSAQEQTSISATGTAPGPNSLRQLTADSPTSTSTQAQDGEDSAATENKTPPSAIRINTFRTLQLGQEQINALVRAELKNWMDSRGYDMPSEIVDPMIALEGQQLILAFEYRSSQFSQVLSAYFSLTFEKNGMVILELEQFQAGLLPIPVDSLGQWLADKTGGSERAEQIGQWLGELNRLEFKPVLEMEHRRRARIESYRIDGDGVELVVRVQDHRTYKQANKKLAGVPTP
jgi:uncharacterized protein YpmS